MDHRIWDFVYSAGAILSVWILFFQLAHRRRWREYYVAFGFSGLIAMVICIWAYVYKYWYYPSGFYDDFFSMMIKDVAFFSVFGMLYTHFMRKELHKNILLVAAMALVNTGFEAATLNFTNLVGYYDKMNYYITFITYCIGYLFVMIHNYIFGNTNLKK
ncbi:CBO0543 family protein [Thermotalea metallivorans]|uniref:Uncharacterized protein n=1 Tax=Thermotalea metallivorans TaxID=520762 RepID=A0A140L3A6_9FIRM|nr:CBO0543 family protein [Thermotalea metallivorans]KXG75031.1 hypothetical protein AN619_20010 [Thermotalea metallivorans]